MSGVPLPMQRAGLDGPNDTHGAALGHVPDASVDSPLLENAAMSSSSPISPAVYAMQWPVNNGLPPAKAMLVLAESPFVSLPQIVSESVPTFAMSVDQGSNRVCGFKLTAMVMPACGAATR